MPDSNEDLRAQLIDLKFVHLDERIRGMESNCDDTRSRVTAAEQRVGAIEATLVSVQHAIERGSEATERVRDAVQRVEENTADLVLMHKAAPRLEARARFWVWVLGTVYVGGQTLVAIYLLLKP